jgi:hypothetical protein
LLTPGCSCMSHSPSVTTTVTTIIHTALTMDSMLLSIGFVCWVWFTMLNSIFLCMNSMVKCGSTSTHKKSHHRKLLGNTIPRIRCSHNLANKARSTETILDKKPAKKQCTHLLKNNWMKQGLGQNTPQKSMRRLAQETSTLKSSAALVTKLLKHWLYKATTVHTLQWTITWWTPYLKKS